MQTKTQFILCGLAAALCLLPGCGSAAAEPASAPASSTASEVSETAPETASTVSETADSAPAPTESIVTGQITAIDGSVITIQPGKSGRPDGEKWPDQEGKETSGKPEDREKPSGETPSDGEAPPSKETPPSDGVRDNGEAPDQGEAPGSAETPDNQRVIPFTAEGDPVQYTITDETSILLENHTEENEAGTLSSLSTGTIVSIQPGSDGTAVSLTVKRMSGGAGGRQKPDAGSSAAE